MKRQRKAHGLALFILEYLHACARLRVCHHAHMCVLCVRVCVGVSNSFLAQLSWVMEFCTGGPCAPLWHRAAIVLLSWSIMSSGGWPCSGGRGPITRLINQAWLLLSSVVPGTPQPVAVWLETGRKKNKCARKGWRRTFWQKMDVGCLSINNWQ